MSERNTVPYGSHAVILSAYKGKELVRTGCGTALKTPTTPKYRCTLITNFHLLLNNDIEADSFVLKSDCTGADGQRIDHSNIRGFEILKDILIFTFRCAIDCPVLKIRKEKLKKNELLKVITLEGSKAASKKVRYKNDRFILDKNVILHEAKGSAREGMSGSPALDMKGKFIGIAAGGLTGKKRNNSLFIIPHHDVLNTYTADYGTGRNNKLLHVFLEAYRAFKRFNHTEAIKNYDIYLNAFPGDAKAHYHKGNVFHHYANINSDRLSFDNAIACYDKALELFPEYTQALFNKGNVYFNMNASDEAIKCYNRLLKITPHYIKAYINRGNEFVKKSLFNKALKDFSTAIRYENGYKLAFNNRGNVYVSLKKFNHAYRDYKTALKLDPEDPDAIFNIGTYHFHMERYNTALKYYNKALMRKPDSIEYLIGRAELYNDMGQVQKAIDEYSKVLVINDKLAIAYYMLGECYEKLGKNDDAVSNWKRAIKLDKSFDRELLGKIDAAEDIIIRDLVRPSN